MCEIQSVFVQIWSVLVAIGKLYFVTVPSVFVKRNVCSGGV